MPYPEHPTKSDAGPLGGMSLLYGSRGILNVVENSDGRIDARPGRTEMDTALTMRLDKKCNKQLFGLQC